VCALKKVKMDKEKDGFPLTSIREINILLSFQHPNIVNVSEARGAALPLTLPYRLAAERQRKSRYKHIVSVSEARGAALNPSVPYPIRRAAARGAVQVYPHRQRVRAARRRARRRAPRRSAPAGPAAQVSLEAGHRSRVLRSQRSLMAPATPGSLCSPQ